MLRRCITEGVGVWPLSCLLFQRREGHCVCYVATLPTLRHSCRSEGTSFRTLPLRENTRNLSAPSVSTTTNSLFRVVFANVSRIPCVPCSAAFGRRHPHQTSCLSGSSMSLHERSTRAARRVHASGAGVFHACCSLKKGACHTPPPPARFPGPPPRLACLPTPHPNF